MEELLRFREECVASAEPRAMFEDMAIAAVRSIEFENELALKLRQGEAVSASDRRRHEEVKQKFTLAKDALIGKCRDWGIPVPDFSADDILHLLA